jgi:hypothetical protein
VSFTVNNCLNEALKHDQVLFVYEGTLHPVC